MKHAAVMAALVPRHRGFLLKNCDLRPGDALLKTICCGQPDNSPADHRDAKTHLIMIAMRRQCGAVS
jgi:hypothetical protein